MRIYLVRHGAAADQGPDGTDSSRPLTAEGIADLRVACAGLNRLQVHLHLILSSPLVRARQTADVLAQCLVDGPPVEILPALSTEGTPAAVTAALRTPGVPSGGHIALVGHEPGIGALAAAWVGARRPINFKKGAVCCVDFQRTPADGGGDLKWFASPKMLMAIGRPDG